MFFIYPVGIRIYLSTAIKQNIIFNGVNNMEELHFGLFPINITQPSKNVAAIDRGRRLIEGGDYFSWYIFSAVINRGRLSLEVLKYIITR